MLRKLLATDSYGLRLAAFLAGLVLTLWGGVALGVDVSSSTENTITSGTVTVSGGGSDGNAGSGRNFNEINVSESDFRVQTDLVLSDGGVITLEADSTKADATHNGSIHMWGTAHDSDWGATSAKNFTMTGGNLTTNGGYLETGKFKMTGGTAAIGGTTSTDSRWEHQGSWITAGNRIEAIPANGSEDTNNASVSLTGGKVILGDGGRIQTTWGDSYHRLFHIGGNAEINMNGSSDATASVLRANDSYQRDDANDTMAGKIGSDPNANYEYSKMLIDGNATINVNANKTGVILSRDTTMNSGLINVASGGKLTIAGATKDKGSATDVIAGLTHGDVKQWGKFTLNGGAIDNKGALAFYTDLALKNGTLTNYGASFVEMKSGTKLELGSGAKLVWSGASGTGDFIKGFSNVNEITLNNSTASAAALNAYLAKQTVSNLLNTTTFNWNDVNKAIAYNAVAAASPSAAMSNVLSQTGSSHMASGLSAGVANTWAGIAAGNSNAPAADLIQNHLNTNTGSDEAQAVVSSLAGFDSAKSLDIAMATSGSVSNRINARVADNNLARSQSGPSSGGAWASPKLNNDFANRFWMGGFGLWEDADRRGFDNGYKYRSGGFIAGYDRIVGPFTLGGSYAFTSGSYEDKNALESDSDIASYALNLYGTYNHWSGFFATLMLGYTYSDYDMANLVTRAGQWDRSSFHSNTWTFGGTIGYDFRPTQSLFISPSIGLYYYTSSTNTFRTTIKRNMQVDQDSAELPLDVAVNYDIPVNDATVRLTANTGYAYNFDSGGGDLDGFGYNGVAGSRISGIKGRDNARHTWNIGVGARYSIGQIDAGLKYDYYVKSDYGAHRLMGTVGVSF